MNGKTAAQMAYERWYQKHKEEFNAKRRARYHDDTEYREKAKEERREYGRRQRAETGERVVRKVNGKKILCYRIGTVAEILDRSIPTLRDWEKRGWIPHPTIPGSHRCYTERQVELILELSEMLFNCGDNSRLVQREIKKAMAAKMLEEWKG